MKPCSRAETEPARSSASSTSITSARRTLCTPSWARLGGQLAGASRVDREHRRMHLHSRRDAEDGNPVADRLQDVDRGPVSAGEQEQIDSSIGHRRGGRARVLRGCDRPGAAEDGRRRAARRRPPARPSRRRMPAPRARRRAPRAARSASVARAGATGRSPRSRAAATSATSSLPLNARRPPMPAIGLTMSPSRTSQPERVQPAQRHKTLGHHCAPPSSSRREAYPVGVAPSGRLGVVIRSTRRCAVCAQRSPSSIGTCFSPGGVAVPAARGSVWTAAWLAGVTVCLPAHASRRASLRRTAPERDVRRHGPRDPSRTR